MISCATFRHYPLGHVVVHTNEHRHRSEVVPQGKFRRGVWAGHPIEFVVMLEILIVGLIGIPAGRWF